MKSWQLQTAKSRLSEVVRDALAEGPQMITLHGKPAVVVLSLDSYQNLAGRRPSLLEVLRSAPVGDLELDFERDPDPGRILDL